MTVLDELHKIALDAYAEPYGGPATTKFETTFTPELMVGIIDAMLEHDVELCHACSDIIKSIYMEQP